MIEVKEGDWVIVLKRDGMDRSFMHEPLEVRGIDGELLLVQRVDSWGAGDIILNQATQEIKKLSEDFKAKILKMREEFKQKEEERDRKSMAAVDPE